MKIITIKNATILTVAALGIVTVAHAQGFDFNAIKQQLAASPAAQQATQGMQQQVMQQALQQAAKNPQLLTSMASQLTPTQQSTLMQQAMAAGKQIFTPAEQSKLASFTSTPEGAGIVAKLPQLVQQLAPTVLQMVAANAGSTAPAVGK